MSTFLSLYFSFALVFCLIRISKTLSFCESFAENGYKISYGLRRITKTDPYLSYVFINQTYWRLVYTDPDQNVILLAEEGKQSNWFGDKYSMAFCVMFGSECKVGLLDLNKNSVFWAQLEDSVDQLKLKREITVNSIQFKYSNVRTAFVPNWGQMDHKMVVFFKQKPKIHYEFFKINDDMTISSQSGPDDPSAEPNSLLSLVPGLEVIAIMAQYSERNYQQKEGSGHGMIILFKFDRTIRYCYTDTSSISKMCTHNPKTLIDCSQTVVRTTTTTLTPVEEPTYFFSISVVVLVVITFVAIVLTLWYYRRNEKLKRGTKIAETSDGNASAHPLGAK